MTVFFQKELASNPLRRRNGKTFSFEVVGDDMGLLATSDENEIAELRSAIARGVGGVSEITEDEYRLKKVIPVVQRGVPQFQPSLLSAELSLRPTPPAQQKSVAEPAVAAKPETTPPPVNPDAARRRPKATKVGKKSLP